MALRLVVLLALTHTALGQNYLAIEWSSKTYGPDGPWNAITMNISQSATEDVDTSSSQLPVDFLVGSYYASYIASSSSCQDYTSAGDCGLGGIWQPGGDTTIKKKATIWDAAAKYNVSGTVYPRGVTIGTSENQEMVDSVDLASMDFGTVEFPNGVTTGLELGFFALNSGMVQDQTWTPGNHTTWIVAGFLYNTSVIPSYSYGLQVGSAALGYPGSLYLGGYDKGRLIGPYSSFSGYEPDLLDITIGVETGDSPFSFQNKSGLLINANGVPKPTLVKIDPMPPGLHLPPQTCQALAASLPVYFDQETNYYLWNTTDPSFERIVTSPAYLGFEFSPAAGATANVTIKVPFKLLNLTLTSPVVSSPVQYFPCIPFVLPDGDTYRLGRAFLQGAFLGYNSETNLVWLAQAPGPGDSNQGLGVQPREIGSEAPDLEVFTGESLFQQSWAAHWTVLNNSDTSSNGTASGSSNATSGSSNSTSTAESGNKRNTVSGGTIAGAVVGALAGVAIIALGALYFLRRKKRQTSPDEKEDVAQDVHEWQDPVSPEVSEVSPENGVQELSSQGGVWELPGHSGAKEMSEESGVKELP